MDPEIPLAASRMIQLNVIDGQIPYDIFEGKIRFMLNTVGGIFVPDIMEDRMSMIIGNDNYIFSYLLQDNAELEANGHSVQHCVQSGPVAEYNGVELSDLVAVLGIMCDTDRFYVKLV
jgi:hypothetical protein